MAKSRDMAKWLAVTFELDAASSLLRRGAALLRGYGFASRDAEHVMVLLATGAEKLLKMTYGVTISARDGSWPARAVMRDYGHDVARLDRDCRQLLRDRAHLAPASGTFTGLLDTLDGDRFIAASSTRLRCTGSGAGFTISTA